MSLDKTMIVTELARDDKTEPIWSNVGLHRCDFRPHFDGDLLNFFTTTYPLDSIKETASLFKGIALKTAKWILENRNHFSSGDCFQIIVGWPLDVRPTGRQVIKTGGTFEDIHRLVDNRDLITIRDGWDTDVFDEKKVE
ncbi:hypothetical protein [Gimesia aquarii]|uniref:Uncharacterized protein n=1 Tax=Gimesia aquarii TaxID=2527964 RepID=A0A517VP97_9PLAN|nr:hypothetical protein [Gimesia aquarii]QDT94829.1 hypothetical protein V144x_02610 [Gimesia aquarii]